VNPSGRGEALIGANDPSSGKRPIRATPESASQICSIDRVLGPHSEGRPGSLKEIGLRSSQRPSAEAVRWPGDQTWAQFSRPGRRQAVVWRYRARPGSPTSASGKPAPCTWPA
jgi:hypothetical protein